MTIGRLLRQTSFKSWSRYLATEVDTLEASLENSLKETHSIESLIQNITSSLVPRVNDKIHRTFDYNTDATVRRHLALKHQRNQSSYFCCRLTANRLVSYR